jgi:hypothetical protein
MVAAVGVGARGLENKKTPEADLGKISPTPVNVDLLPGTVVAGLRQML